jgi:methylated-DNA-[protein]-cysteine S-methyltransferase
VITQFQKRVYAAVKTIPKGQTRSYKWVAERIGNPKAVRAVGQALKKNPFLGKVPCHRVVCSNGKIGGYVLGIKKKKQLLKQEGARL